jgi:hypothetical protein
MVKDDHQAQLDFVHTVDVLTAFALAHDEVQSPVQPKRIAKFRVHVMAAAAALSLIVGGALLLRLAVGTSGVGEPLLVGESCGTDGRDGHAGDNLVPGQGRNSQLQAAVGGEPLADQVTGGISEREGPIEMAEMAAGEASGSDTLVAGI